MIKEMNCCSIGRIFAAGLFFFVSAVSGWSVGPLSVITWNVESGGNEPAVIAEQLTSFQGYDIIALQETDDKLHDFYTEALGPEYESVLTVTGKHGNDHLLTIYNTETLTLRRSFELHQYGGVVITPNVSGGGKRSPLITYFTDKRDGSRFICINVHFDRSDAAHRCLQSFVLREWVISRAEPTVVLGDCNFDYNFLERDPGNEAFKLFTFGGQIRWVEPEVFIDTNYSERSGRETYPDSIIDFIFAANGAENWRLISQVIVREGDFPDTESTSDHRPVAGFRFKS